MAKFKKFDRVIGLKPASGEYSTTKEGWGGTVWGYTPKGQLIVSGQDRFGTSSIYYVDEQYFGLEERIQESSVKYLIIYQHIGFSIEPCETVGEVKERVAELMRDVSINHQTITIFEISSIIPPSSLATSRPGEEGQPVIRNSSG